MVVISWRVMKVVSWGTKCVKVKVWYKLRSIILNFVCNYEDLIMINIKPQAPVPVPVPVVGGDTKTI